MPSPGTCDGPRDLRTRSGWAERDGVQVQRVLHPAKLLRVGTTRGPHLLVPGSGAQCAKTFGGIFQGLPIQPPQAGGRLNTDGPADTVAVRFSPPSFVHFVDNPIRDELNILAERQP
jgi:hypothetical protein